MVLGKNVMKKQKIVTCNKCSSSKITVIAAVAVIALIEAQARVQHSAESPNCIFMNVQGFATAAKICG